ncbi:hypothetical protein BO78DRAFT_454801 [Aspergillus sclerotiicarbonarius CBS 121057]|uniref:Uncharacterized protein n=1 Tax=Aspergillus sclerotiicarbonarius (strain CBS 121057 / IBT 28362) TaxID=1448318 RepID=A0A319DW14_ASPSB|nr:hypothetical protein BO78DRAFT_454801 [Aspergillus sclerotiicarbonarius CBS 121057]
MPPQRRTPCDRYDLRSKAPVDREISQVLDAFLKAARISKARRVKKPEARTHTFTARIQLHFVRNSEKRKEKEEEDTCSSSESDPDPSCDSEMEVDDAKTFTLKHYPNNRRRLNMPDRLLVVHIETQEKVPLDAIIDAKYMPSDEDAEFQCRVDRWQDPATEDADPNLNWLDLYKNLDPEKRVFSRFFRHIRESHYNGWTDDHVFDSLGWLFNGFSSDEEISFEEHTYLPLTKVRLGKCDDGIYFHNYIVKRKYDETAGRYSFGFPLAVCICKPRIGQRGIARSEITPLLLQANLGYEYNPNREQYPAYLLSQRDWNFRFVKATMSRQEVERLRAKETLSGKMQIQRTRAFNIHHRAERKEFVRAVTGLLRFFEDRPEAAYPMYTSQWFSRVDETEDEAKEQTKEKKPEKQKTEEKKKDPRTNRGTCIVQ